MVSALTLFASPCCKAELEGPTCSSCGKSFEQRDGFFIFAREPRFDAKYETDRDPWSYADRAAEVLKYRFLFETAASLIRHRTDTVADIGCATGLLTTRLAELSDRLAAVDVSPNAVAKVKRSLGERVEVAAASATALPFADGAMQLLVMSDGLVSWGLDEAQRALAVAQAHRALAPGGHAIFMEYLNPRRHHELIDPIAKSPFSIERIALLHDRLWYVTDSVFRALKGTAVYRAFASNVAWAKGLRLLSRGLGRRGSKHLCVIARR